MPNWFTRRLWWRIALTGAFLSSVTTIILGQWMVADTVYWIFLIPTVIVLHPLMDQPVKPFGPGILCPRLYIGGALAALAIAVESTLSS